MSKTIKCIGLTALAGVILLSGCRTADTPAAVVQNTTGTQSAGTTTTPTATSVTQPSLVVSDDTDEYGNPVGESVLGSHFPLYAMIKSENIYLYGIGSANEEGML
ncbi:MAG: hypothetical protein FWF49_00165 [Oscillospiraceae bacterium]|nr:hypothetical protein [Oscillospiraceae bacterium]